MLRIVLVMLFGACSLHVEASVMSAATNTAPARPVAGATVAMICPQWIKATVPSVFGTTDAQGQLDFHETPGGRSLHDECTMAVDKPGFAPWRAPVKGLCLEYKAGLCAHIRLQVSMTPLPP